MKVAYILTRLDEIGGAQIHVRDLATALKTQGGVPVVIAGTGGALSDYFDHMGIEHFEAPDLVRPINPSQDMKAYRQIMDLLRAIKPDLVSCHSSKAGILGRLAAKRLGIPVLFTAHGWSFTDGVSPMMRQAYKLVETWAAGLCDHIITVSDYDRALAIEAGVADAGKITTIHNGMLDRPAPARAASAPDGSDPGEPCRLLMVARFGAQKDHATLIDALATLRDLSFELDLVGGGDNTGVFQQTQQAGLIDDVTFWGERLDVPEMMDASDIFILSTHWEGFPRSILEAMRSQLPVVATNVAGVPESVTDGGTGILVPRRDAAALAQALRALITDPARRQEMGRAGRARFDARFTFAVMSARTFALYEQLVDKSGSQPRAA